MKNKMNKRELNKMNIEIGICKNLQSQFNTQKKQHNDSCKNWIKHDYKHPISTNYTFINSNNMICATCNFWNKVSEMKPVKLGE